jgi:addiction module HigA family antidote
MTSPKRDPRRRPTHPGEILREDMLPALGWTQEQFAARLGVTRVTVARLLLEHAAMSPTMALRLNRLLGTPAEVWMAMQSECDMWDARQSAATLNAIRPLTARERGRLRK